VPELIPDPRLAELQALLPRPESLNPESLRIIANDFQVQMGAALEGGESSLKMINTQLPASIFAEKLQKNKTCLVVDSGGTGPKAALYKTNEQGELQIATREDGSEIVFEGSFNDKKDWTADEFFRYHAEAIAEQWKDDDIKRMLEEVDAVSYIFSYAADAVPNENGVDAKVQDRPLTKGWTITDLNKGPVGKQLVNALEARFKVTMKSNLTVLVENDTVVLLDPDSQFAGVCATGYNYAIRLPNGVYNTECGGFKSEKLLEVSSGLFKQYDQGHQPGQQIAEKMISGQGVGGQFEIYLQEAIAKKLIPESLMDSITCPEDYNRFMSALLAPPNSRFAKNFLDKAIFYGMDSRHAGILRTAAEALVEHSANVHAAMIMGLAQQAQIRGGYPKNEFDVPIEGSFFWRTPDYVAKLTSALQKINPNFVFNFVGEGKRIGLKGGAKQALLLNEMQSRRIDV
jgi:hexokinase